MPQGTNLVLNLNGQEIAHTGSGTAADPFVFTMVTPDTDTGINQSAQVLITGNAASGYNLAVAVTDDVGTVTSPTVPIPQCCNNAIGLSLNGNELTATVTDAAGTLSSAAIPLPQCCNTGLTLALGGPGNRELTASVSDANGTLNAGPVTIPSGSVVANPTNGNATITFPDGTSKNNVVCGVQSSVQVTQNSPAPGQTTFDFGMNDGSAAQVVAGGSANDMVLTGITCDNAGVATFTIANGSPVSWNVLACITGDGTSITGNGSANDPFVAAPTPVNQGSNTTVTGSGTAADPYVINSVTNCAEVVGCISVTQGANVTVTGAGSTASPYVISSTLASVSQGANTTVSGTGTAADPYVINAQTNCAEVVGCISVTPGTNSTVTGTGSAADPYVVSAVTNCAEVVGCISVTQGANITVTGTGSVADPYVISGPAAATTSIADGVNTTVTGTGTVGDPYVINSPTNCAEVVGCISVTQGANTLVTGTGSVADPYVVSSALAIVTPGANATVTGTGTFADPYVVGAVTNCAEVVACVSVTQGTNTTVTGTGSVADPYVVNSTTNCAEVVGCISVTEGTNVTVTGTGSVADPYVINAAAGVTVINDGVNTTVTGSGTAGDPYIINSPTNCPEVLACINVDNVTITGTGTAADPFVSVAPTLTLSDSEGNLTFIPGANDHIVEINVDNLLIGGSTGEIGDTGNWTPNTPGQWNAVKNVAGELVGFLDPNGVACPVPSNDGNHAFFTDLNDVVDPQALPAAPPAGAPNGDNNGDTLTVCHQNGTTRWNWNGTAWVLSSFKSSDVEVNATSDVTNAAVGAPADTSTPANPPATIAGDFHVHCESWRNCDVQYFYVGGAIVKSQIIAKSGGCTDEPAVDLTAAGTLPTTIATEGFSEYNLEVTTDAANSVSAGQFTTFMNGLAKPIKGEGVMYHVWNVGDGTIEATHPRVPALTLTANQGDAICLKCCNGAWQIQLS